MASQHTTQSATLDVENVGGIDHTTVELPPGVTVLTGRNATNRTSFLQSVMAVCGSDDVSLKSDAEEGHVELTLGDETFTRHLTRQRESVALGGDPYLDDATTADLFAFLLESNEARRAVVTEQNLREVIMRPVDTDAVEAEIERLKTERDRIERELDDLSSLEAERRRLDARHAELQDELETLEAERDELAAEIEAADATVDAQQAQQAELDEVIGDLQDVQSELERIRFRLDSERESIQSLRQEREDVEASLADLGDDTDAADLSSRIDHIRGQLEELNASITDLQTIVQFTADVLDGDQSELVDEALGDESASGAVTDQLVASETTRCWTCGSEVDREQIEQTTDRLRTLRDDKRDRRAELRSELESLEAQRRERERKQDRRTQLETRLQRLENELARREETVSTLEAERDDLKERNEALEARADSLRDQTQDDLLERHKELNKREFELDQRREDLRDVAEQREQVDARLDRRDELETRRAELGEELGEARTRIERIETQAVDAFNEEMERVLDLLEYQNLERVWLERVERRVREGRQKVTRSQYELHIVRESSDGAVYEDTIHHLSESEREVVGLVFALAGYLVHDVYEDLPFMLLDSLEALDAPRIARLVEHFEQYPTYLVVALLPEDAQALDNAYSRVEWTD